MAIQLNSIQFNSVQTGKLWRCWCDSQAKTLFLHKEQTETYFYMYNIYDESVGYAIVPG